MNSTKQNITPEEKFLNRRVFMNYGIWASLFVGCTPSLFGSDPKNIKVNDAELKNDLNQLVTKEEVATSYNNFYEFSLDKAEVKPKVEKRCSSLVFRARSQKELLKPSTTMR